MRFKKLLAVGLQLFITLPTSLSLIACNVNQNKTIFNENDIKTLIVKTINKTNYIQNIAVNTTLSDFKTSLNSEFIKNQLDKNFKKDFEDNLFKILEIKKDNRNLTDDDFKKPIQFKIKVIYSYGSIKNQEIKLTINVIYTEQQIVEKVNAEFYDIRVKPGTSAEILKNQIINPSFISSKLNDDIKKFFKPEYLTIHYIIDKYKENEISDKDLAKYSKVGIDATINYTYKGIDEMQKVPLLVLFDKNDKKNKFFI